MKVLILEDLHIRSISICRVCRSCWTYLRLHTGNPASRVEIKYSWLGESKTTQGNDLISVRCTSQGRKWHRPVAAAAASRYHGNKPIATGLCSSRFSIVYSTGLYIAIKWMLFDVDACIIQTMYPFIIHVMINRCQQTAICIWVRYHDGKVKARLVLKRNTLTGQTQRSIIASNWCDIMNSRCRIVNDSNNVVSL